MRHFAIPGKIRHIGLALAVCLGLLPVLPKGFAEPPQAGAASATEAAGRAYGELAAKHYDDAIQEFQRALAADPANTIWRKDLAFTYLAAGLAESAVAEFARVYADHPEDTGVALQLGYLYAAAGKGKEAREMFIAARQDADPKLAAQAKAALNEVSRDSRPWFASVYAAPFYQSRFSNQVNPLTAKIGLKPSPYFQPYVGLRFSRDVRSRSGTLPQIFSDNSAVVSGGVQSSLRNTGAMIYGEAGTALSLTGERRAVPDYRAGISWFKPWGSGLMRDERSRPAISWTGSLYADAAFYSRYNRNVIAFLQLREGITLPTTRVLPAQILVAINLVKDSRAYFYNNVVEAGPALRIAPVHQWPALSVEAQYLRGFYMTHDSANPYGPRYGDFRIFLIWSKTF